MSNKVIIVGGFIEIIELCEDNNLEICGIIDNKQNENNRSYPIIGVDSDAEDIFKKFPGISLVISPDNPKIRQKLYFHYEKFDFRFRTVLSKNAFISKSASIGTGTIIQVGSNISSEVIIGEFVKINSFANVMHNARIGNYTTIAPNAVILGYADIGKNCYIGSNATILPNIRICDDVIIGAGAVVTKNITIQNSIYKGVPAKIVLKKTL